MIENSQPFRLRITFAKTAAMRFTGHLDLQRAWERSFRRADLPLAYSQGFHHRPRLNLASALPLGFTSRAEVLDVWLEEDIPPAVAAQALEGALPPGIKVVQIENVELRAPTLQSELEASEFLITLLDPVSDLPAKAETLLSAPNLPRRWRDKDYDLRPLILAVQIHPAEQSDKSEGLQQLSAILSAREGSTGRPEELVEAMGIDPFSIRVERTRLIFRTD